MADKADAYSQDVLTRIYNVHWAGGLAVEFGDKAEGPLKPDPAALLSSSHQIKGSR
jgi:hypothetical protein